MKTLIIILLILSILALLSFIVATFFFVKNSILYKEELEAPEDKNGLYDFIKIKDDIFNVNNIVHIKRIESIQEEDYKIIIELNDNKEPIIFDYDDDYQECSDVFEQLVTTLDSAIIVTD